MFCPAGGNIAAAWVALKAMGVDGYMKMAKQLMDTTERLKKGINSIPVSDAFSQVLICMEITAKTLKYVLSIRFITF